MANYTAADIKALRESTGAGMLDVKKALDEADGDRAKATEILRVKGLKGVTKREGRTTSNGLVTAQAGDGVGTLVEVLCETDFVAKGEKFIALAAQVLAQAVASGASDADALLKSSLEDGSTVQELLDGANATIGEKIEVKRVARIEAPVVVSYLHKTSPDLPAQIGVLVGTEGGDEQVARDVAMHIAAFSPTVLTRDEVDADDGRERASRRRGHRQGGGQARGRPPQDRRGSRQRLLQGERPARAAVRQGRQEVGREGPHRGRHEGHLLRPLPHRQLTDTTHVHDEAPHLLVRGLVASWVCRVARSG